MPPLCRTRVSAFLVQSQRKQALLKEFEEKDRAGGIIDRRFGENDPTLTPEERMLERFTREKQRASKGAAFHLEDEVDLTHYGQSLSKLDDFPDVGLELESGEEEATGTRSVQFTLPILTFLRSD